MRDLNSHIFATAFSYNSELMLTYPNMVASTRHPSTHEASTHDKPLRFEAEPFLRRKALESGKSLHKWGNHVNPKIQCILDCTGSNRFSFNNFKHFLTLFSKFFSSFPHGTCSLSVSHKYLALDEVYHPSLRFNSEKRDS